MRIHRAANHCDGLAHQRFCRIRRAGLDHDTGALVAHGHGFIESSRHGFHRRFRDLRGNHRRSLGAGRFCARHVGGADQQAEVRRIDRRGLDADHDFVGTRFSHGHAGERDFEFTALLDQRAKLQSGLGVGAHPETPYLRLCRIRPGVFSRWRRNASLYASHNVVANSSLIRRAKPVR